MAFVKDAWSLCSFRSRRQSLLFSHACMESDVVPSKLTPASCHFREKCDQLPLTAPLRPRKKGLLTAGGWPGARRPCSASMGISVASSDQLQQQGQDTTWAGPGKTLTTQLKGSGGSGQDRAQGALGDCRPLPVRISRQVMGERAPLPAKGPKGTFGGDRGRVHAWVCDLTPPGAAAPCGNSAAQIHSL